MASFCMHSEGQYVRNVIMSPAVAPTCVQALVSELLQCLWHSEAAALTAHCCFRLKSLVTLLQYNL